MHIQQEKRWRSRGHVGRDLFKQMSRREQGMQGISVIIATNRAKIDGEVRSVL